ncbi:V-snare-domain-containing protein [Annulohypoxylon truncatum]|uniref:V-snare-domain-containing protein n=1 Tax=Annulohypoxylon truncatum TaxID=327061 RepID=UPI0020072C3B|nr:V-snare-domain-containing protein [Annulohypoxylon truncatum]KAI1206016.1 V-snare-domain-containing protein [Annulohypoxylon truncatum]
MAKNTQFNSALKQSTSIKRDLTSITSAPDGAPPTPAALGSLSASLTAFSRTLDEYNALAKQELNPAKQEKAYERIKNFRSELSSFRTQLDELKTRREDALHSQNRSELLGRRPFATATPENPYANMPPQTSPSVPPNRYGSGGSQLSMGSNDYTRESHALREQTFFANTNTALDEYIARGQAVLGDLGTQREMLKNTQKRLYSVANTLGVSGDTIRMIERRAKQDKWIFWGGVVVFFGFCWLCLHYLR